MTFRMRDELRAAYASRAEKNGSSISEEVEKSLEREGSLSKLISEQEKLIHNQKILIENGEKQIDSYKHIVDETKRLSKFVSATNHYILKRMYDLNSQILDDMVAGRDLSKRVGTKEDCENLLTTLRNYFAQNPEPDLTEVLKELRN